MFWSNANLITLPCVFYFVWNTEDFLWNKHKCLASLMLFSRKPSNWCLAQLLFVLMENHEYIYTCFLISKLSSCKHISAYEWKPFTYGGRESISLEVFSIGMIFQLNSRTRDSRGSTQKIYKKCAGTQNFHQRQMTAAPLGLSWFCHQRTLAASK